MGKDRGIQTRIQKRACHEGKNGEMKRLHGMDRARGYGLRSMQIQVKLTALAVNLKRIGSLISPFLNKKWVIMVNNGIYLEKGLMFKAKVA